MGLISLLCEICFWVLLIMENAERKLKDVKRRLDAFANPESLDSFSVLQDVALQVVCHSQLTLLSRSFGLNTGPCALFAENDAPPQGHNACQRVCHGSNPSVLTAAADRGFDSVNLGAGDSTKWVSWLKSRISSR